MTRWAIYPDTSFWVRLADPVSHERRKTSYRFLRCLRGRDRIYVSKLILREISETPDQEVRRQVLRRLWSSRPRMVTTNRRSERIALDLLDAGGWGEDMFADMLHVSYSMASGIDALVTWDEGDLARDHTRRIAQAYGRRQRLSVPLIGTPEEVAQWLGLRIR